MKTKDSPHQELLRENKSLRERIAELEAWNSECVRAGEALAKTGETFHKIFDHSNDGIFIVDPDADRIVDVNQRAATMLGYTVEELVRQPLSAIHPKDIERLREFSRTVRKRGAGWTSELSCRTRTGETVQAEVSASSLELPHGNYMIALVRDISERKAVQDELRRANERMHADLQAAAEIQRSLLPTRSHLLRGVRIGWDFKPSELLAGDLLNIFRLDEDHIGMYVLDVSGHGVRAAMHSLSLNRALSPYAGPTSLLLHQNDWESSEIVPPGQVATELSRAFPFDPETGQFVTLLYGVLNRRTREFRFVSAGHCAPVYVPPGGEPREIEEYGFPIGIVPETPYEDHTITLEPGGRLYLYSDGLTEAMDGKGDLFDRERLLAAIAGAKDVALEESIGRVMSAVEAWSCDTCPRDDMTLLGVELHE